MVEIGVEVEEFERRVRDRIVQLRKDRKLTQESFDTEPNAIPVRTIQRYEQAREPNIELRTLVKIAQKLNLKPKDLLDVESE